MAEAQHWQTPADGVMAGGEGQGNADEESQVMIAIIDDDD